MNRKSLLRTGGYKVLPKNLLISTGTLWEDFENDADWTAASGAESDNAVEFKTGAQSVKLTANAGATATMTKTVTWDMSGDWGGLSFWMYVHDAPADYGTNIYRLDLSNDAAFTNYVRAYYDKGQMVYDALGGWFRVYIPKSYFNVVAGGTFANAIVRIRFYTAAAALKTPSISYDDFEVGEKHQPAMVIRFDDATADHYSVAYQYMKQFKIRGTVYTPSASIGGGGYCTWAQLQEMSAAGWAIANHTRSHTPLKALTVLQNETAIGNCITDLTAQGLSKSSIYLAYPGGGANPHYDANTHTAMTNLGVRCGNCLYDMFGPAAETTSRIPQILPSNFYNDMFHNFGQTHATSVTSLANMLVMIDKTILAGGILPPYIHVLDSGGQLTTAQFQTWIDYIRTKALAGLITPITIDDYYKLTLGPVRVPKVR